MTISGDKFCAAPGGLPPFAISSGKEAGHNVAKQWTRCGFPFHYWGAPRQTDTSGKVSRKNDVVQVSIGSPEFLQSDSSPNTPHAAPRA